MNTSYKYCTIRAKPMFLNSSGIFRELCAVENRAVAGEASGPRVLDVSGALFEEIEIAARLRDLIAMETGGQTPKHVVIRYYNNESGTDWGPAASRIMYYGTEPKRIHIRAKDDHKACWSFDLPSGWALLITGDLLEHQFPRHVQPSDFKGVTVKF